MIKILFDHEIFSEQRYGGISRYFANLEININKNKGYKVVIGVLYVKNYYIRNYSQKLNNFIGRYFLRKDHKRYKWNKKYSQDLMTKGNYNLLHATYYDDYSLEFNSKPLVITIHDMIHENSPEMFSNSAKIIEQKNKMMMAATKIIAISKFTKNEILKFYPEFGDKTVVVYHGISIEENKEIKSDQAIPANFLLFVGERSNYKSFKPFVSAIATFLIENPHVHLVAAGGGDFKEDEIEFLTAHKILDKTTQIHATDKVLKHLYQNALVFVYPSTQEGFGLPILEAFSSKCPIACSNSSCLPEIGGDAVLYFDTSDKDSIRSAVEKIVKNKELANELRLKGTSRLSDFSLEKCISETLSVYDDSLC